MRIRHSAAALAALVAGSAAFAAPAVAAPVQVPFAYSGSTQYWTVPAGVTEATFTLQGAAGGGAEAGGQGGVGAEVHATIPVTPTERLTIEVGGQGTSAGIAGYNGGGLAGDNGLAPDAGSGGGATTILSSSGASLLVAAGGGGGGGTGDGITPGTGGDGGAAENPGLAGLLSGVSTPGGGGLQSGVGGAAGRGTVPGVAGLTTTTSAGGAGGAQAVASAGGNGGGGGGGFVGGGGGGAGGSTDATTEGAGGGGGAGGQNFVTASASNVATALATQRNNGIAVVSYEPLASPEIRTQPTLSGVAQVGRALTCELGTWTGSPALTVAWLRNGLPIAGATSATYTLATADAGQQLACQVTATNAAGTTVSRTPALTIPVTTGPSNAAVPTVTGSSAIGSRLTCNLGTWSGTPTFAYAWLRNGRAVAGQTTSSYTLSRTDAGQSIQCAVTATVDGQAVTAQTAAVGGPARLVILSTSAFVSRTGGVSVQIACYGPTDCVVPTMTATSGQVIARAGARTVRSGNSSRYTIRLGKRGLDKLRRPGSSIAVRFVCPPNGGYGGNARLTWAALKGTA
ncbi:hypothetical protein [Conexibacter sp. CPCC 206217]|uniref:hypothetical protein n=1 Tax=Conexibacter sp. CPCC 206217 TaxID=3064574 RepID=UPI00271E32EB|nr:hypothetical protein [Conexibacter sp. CPCC 206217]MDO8211102.1 hypothetical protein [Conexibacter sp. CPCC 206217]